MGEHTQRACVNYRADEFKQVEPNVIIFGGEKWFRTLKMLITKNISLINATT